MVLGYFYPLHKGYLAYFGNAKKPADFLLLIRNTEVQRAVKESKVFKL